MIIKPLLKKYKLQKIKNKFMSIFFVKRQILLARGIVLNAAAFEFHRTIVETLEPFAEAETLAKVNSFHQGNKMAILTGDLLIVNTVRSVSALKNSRVTFFISKIIPLVSILCP